MRSKKNGKKARNAEDRSIPAMIQEAEGALNLLERKIVYYANLNSEFYSNYEDIKRIDS